MNAELFNKKGRILKKSKVRSAINERLKRMLYSDNYWDKFFFGAGLSQIINPRLR